MFAKDNLKEELKERERRIRELEKELRSTQEALQEREESVQVVQKYLSTVDARLNVHLELNKLIARSDSEDELLKGFAALITKGMKCDATLIWLKDPAPAAGASLQAVLAALDGGSGSIQKGERIPLDSSVAGWVIANHEPMMVREIPKETKFRDHLSVELKLRMFTLLSLPLTIKDETIGAVEVLNSEDQKRFVKEDLTNLSSLIEPVLIFYQNLHVIQQVRREVQRLKVMQEIMTLLNSTRDPGKLIPLVARMLCKTLRAESCLFFLIDDQSRELVLQSTEGIKGGMRIPFQQYLAGQIARERKPLIYNDVLREIGSMPAVFDKSKVKMFLGLPIETPERLIGVVELLNRVDATPFSPADIHLFETLSLPIARTLENSLMYQLVRGTQLRTGA